MRCVNLISNLKLIRSCSKIKCLLREYSATSLFKRYSQDEQAEILSTLHRYAKENISSNHLNEKQLKNIQQFLECKESNQEFSSLDEVLLVDGIGLQTLKRICKSIIENDGSTEKPIKVRIVSGLLTPPLHKNKDTTIEAVVGLNIGFNAISWAKFHCGNRELQDWNIYNMSESVEKKLDLHTVYKIASEVLSSVPNADMYLMENTNWTNVTNSKISIALHIRQALLTTAIMTLFNNRDNVENSEAECLNNKVYFLKSFIPARLFKTLVGSEKVTAQNIVEDIFLKKPDIRYSELSIPFELYDSYKLFDGYLKENMCQSLLLVIAFTELVLFKNTNAMRIVAERSKNKKSL